MLEQPEQSSSVNDNGDDVPSYGVSTEELGSRDSFHQSGKLLLKEYLQKLDLLMNSDVKTAYEFFETGLALMKNCEHRF